MTFLGLFVVFFTFFLTHGTRNVGKNVDDKAFCKQFDNNRRKCENSFKFGGIKCNYVRLNGTTKELVCVPDNCGQYELNEKKCNRESNCIWYNDQNTQIDIFRCYPRCYNNVDILFLVDASATQSSVYNGNLESASNFIKYQIPDFGENNFGYDVRECIIAFAANEDDSDDHINQNPANFEMPYTFLDSTQYSQEELGDITQNELFDANLRLGSQTPLKEAIYEAILSFENGTRADAQRILVIYGDEEANVACTRCPNDQLETFYINRTTSSGANITIEDEVTPCGFRPWLDALDIRVLFFNTDPNVLVINPEDVHRNIRCLVSDIRDVFTIGDLGSIPAPSFARDLTPTEPSCSRTESPTVNPTSNPTFYPTKNPTTNPSLAPTKYPSGTPSLNPSYNPTISPSANPTSMPTFYPSKSPTSSPIKKTTPWWWWSSRWRSRRSNNNEHNSNYWWYRGEEEENEEEERRYREYEEEEEEEEEENYGERRSGRWNNRRNRRDRSRSRGRRHGWYN